MMRAVLDTNVLVSAAIKKQGKPERILLAMKIVRRALAEGKASSEGLPSRWNFAVLHGGALRVEAVAVVSRVF